MVSTSAVGTLAHYRLNVYASPSRFTHGRSAEIREEFGMNMVVLLIILLLLFGGGGFYLGGPAVGGGLGGVILLVLIVLLLTGRL